jgi:hypothetical protein
MKFTGPIRILSIAALSLTISAPVFASDVDANPSVDLTFAPSVSSATLNIPATPARMSPELALQVHDARTKLQASELGEYADTTTIEAELPQIAQKGRYQLRRMYSAPKSLAFKAVNFVGDNFVKTNVIARLLQSEVDHAKTADDANTAITTDNYKFSYKGVAEVEGKPLCHVFQVKPRHKRVGLFKGTIYLDVYTGAMVRAEGRMVKSPSFFVKNIEFSQDYTNVDGFDMVSHIHSTADARIVGKTIVDITHTDVQARSVYELQASSPVQQQTPTMRSVSYTAGSER